MSTVSVIIPCYNTGRYLAEAIQSVLDQTYHDFEIIIVDDGSTDDTREVARRFDDSRVHYIWQANKGLAGARNTGLRAAKGELVAFLDADDTYLPEKLQSEVEVMLGSPGIAMVVNGWIFVDPEGSPLDIVQPWQEHPADPGLAYWLLGLPFVVHGVMLRRDKLAQIGYFDETLKASEDWDLFIRLAAGGSDMVWGRKIVCTYRIHQQNMTRSGRRLLDKIRVLDKYYAVATNGDEQARTAAYANAWLQVANTFYMSGETAEAQACIHHAIEACPELLHQDSYGLRVVIRNWTLDPRVASPLDHLEHVLTNLPGDVGLSEAGRKKLRAQANMDLAFSSHNRGNRRHVIPMAVQAMFHDPAWLKNRGAWSIMIKSLTG